MIGALLHGILLAFGLIIPLGAQNVFVFNQGALQSQFRKAFPVIFTAALCDTFLILLAVAGVSVIVLTMPILQTILFGFGLLFLVYMGWSIWKSSPASVNKHETAMPLKKQVLFALSVSLLNPHAILDTIGVIGTSSLTYIGKEKIVFTVACIIVSWLWFFGLALVGKMIGKLDSEGKFLKVINKLSAIIIWAVATYIAWQLFHHLS